METYDEFIKTILNTRGRFACNNEYHERHHIIPKCIGGNDDEENLVDLFAREHFIAHRLLAQENPDNNSLVFAYTCMAFRKSGTQQRYELTPEEYEEARICLSKTLSTFAKERLIIPENNPYYGRGEPVVQLSLNGEFITEYVSASEAAKVLNVWEGSIRRTCYDNIGAPYGFLWRFKKDYYPNKIYEPQYTLYKAVVQLTKLGDFIAEYESVRIASDTTGVIAQSISNCCHGDIPSAGGFIWIFKADYDPNKQYIWKNGTCTEIVQLTLSGEFIAQYDSINQASHITGVGSSAIGKCCSHKSKSSGGYIWMKLSEYNNKNNL